jgi:hypothetical protein
LFEPKAAHPGRFFNPNNSVIVLTEGHPI